MSIKRYPLEKDNTISSAFKLNLSDRGTTSNMGSSDILEVFAIFGQSSSSSLEQSRALVQFPVDQLLLDRNAGILPASGSARFKLKMFNAEHNQTVPEKVTCTAHPLVKSWTEGGGLDMESFLDTGASNWLSASAGVPWANQGGDFLSSNYMASSPIPMSYEQYLQEGTENIDIDITQLVEEFLINQAGNSVPANGSILFNTTTPPAIGDKFKIYAYNGDFSNFEFAAEEATVGNTYYIKIGGSPQVSTQNFVSILNVSSSIKGAVAATATDSDLKVSLTQRVATFYGNTDISASVGVDKATVTDFTGGKGALNYGVLLRLSSSLEDGSASRSYYTKKFFARSSHHFLERPTIEVQWDSAIKDDRANATRSSSLKPATDNLNNIYLYNKQRTGLVDIPNTSSNLVVQFVPSIGSAPVTITGDTTDNNYVSSSKHSTGIYKAQFAYDGTEGKLHDVWKIHQELTASIATITISSHSSFKTSSPADKIEFQTTDGTAITATAHASTTSNSDTNAPTFDVGDGSNGAVAANLAACLSANSKLSAHAVDNVVRISQVTPGATGNKTITLTDASPLAMSKTDFTGGFDLTYTDILSGSSFAVEPSAANQSHEIPSYVTNVTNLKPAYSGYENPTFRVYTRNKNWQPNVYTVASNKVPVNTIRDAYYKISRVADNMTIIDYSTGSLASYSSLSYDASGSYFDLDMSILEPNYLYEISFLYKDGTDYTEQKEKFKFRVDP
jgi:hypothetical protein